MRLTTHIAPPAGTASLLGSTPVISVAALAGIPAFVRHAFGGKVLSQASKAALLDIEAIEHQDCFVPHHTMLTFLEAVMRLSREQELGLLLAPHLSIASYGCWGQYVMGGHTLGAAVERAAAAMAFHSKGDIVSLTVVGHEARIAYASAVRGLGLQGYRPVACGTAGVVLSACRAYLPADWKPRRIELDIPRPLRPQAFEDAFGCAVIFDAPEVAVWLDAERLQATPLHHGTPSLITLGDVARARIACDGLQSLGDVVIQQMWSQVLTGSVSIDSAARALDTSVRTLQRELNRQGLDFRSLANALRCKRALELLSRTGASVTHISASLGYSAPAHFARAFRKATGWSPQEFRQHGVAPRSEAGRSRSRSGENPARPPPPAARPMLATPTPRIHAPSTPER